MTARSLSNLSVGTALALAAATPTSPLHAADVSGRVTTSNGVGIPGVDIDVIDENGVSIPLLDDDTDADGSFDFFVDTGRYRVRFSAQPGQPLVSREFKNWLLTGFIVDWIVVLDIGAQVSGTVRGPGGTPQAGTDISIRRTDTESGVFSPTDETDASGQFTVVVPFDAPIELTIEPPAATNLLAKIQAVGPFGADGNIGAIDLTAGHRVSGFVRSSGAPVAGADIDAVDGGGSPFPLGHDKTSTTGAFEVILPIGDFRLVASPRLASRLAPVWSSTFSVTGDRAVPELNVAPGWEIEGTVTTTSVAPVPDARLHLELGGAEVPVSGDRTNERGEYLVVGPPGTYVLVAEAPAFRELETGRVSGVVLDQDRVVDVTLQPLTPILEVSEFVAIADAAGALCVWFASDLRSVLGFRLRRMTGADVLEPVHAGWLTPMTALEGFSYEGTGSSGTFSMRDAHYGADDRYVLEALRVNGSIDALGPIAVSPGSIIAPSPVALGVRPNPVVHGAIVRFALPAGGISGGTKAPTLAIYDIAGARVLHRGDWSSVAVAGGELRWELPSAEMHDLPPGVYFVTASWQGVRRSTKLLRLSSTP